MNNLRLAIAEPLKVTIRPTFGPCVTCVKVRSISLASRESNGVTSTPNDGATVWIAVNWPISGDDHARDRWCNLLEQLRPLRTQTKLVLNKSRGIAAGSRQALDQSAVDRIGDTHEDDRNGLSHPLQLTYPRSADNQNKVRSERSQFWRIFSIKVRIASTPAIVNLQIAAQYPAAFLQPTS